MDQLLGVAGMIISDYGSFPGVAGMISDYGSFPHSLRLAPVSLVLFWIRHIHLLQLEYYIIEKPTIVGLDGLY